MSADGNFLFCRHRHGLAHNTGVTSMETAGNVYRRDKIHQRFVVAYMVASEAFAHVAIQVNVCHTMFPVSPDKFSAPSADPVEVKIPFFPLHQCLFCEAEKIGHHLTAPVSDDGPR